VRGSGGLIMKVTLEDGIFAVVRIDPRAPRVSELIGIFSTISPTRSYAEGEADLSVEEPFASREVSNNASLH
jgi:hypothetical protein